MLSQDETVRVSLIRGFPRTHTTPFRLVSITTTESRKRRNAQSPNQTRRSFYKKKKKNTITRYDFICVSKLCRENVVARKVQTKRVGCSIRKKGKRSRKVFPKNRRLDGKKATREDSFFAKAKNARKPPALQAEGFDARRFYYDGNDLWRLNRAFLLENLGTLNELVLSRV